MTQRTKPASLKQYGRAFRATSLSAATDAKIRAAIDCPQRPRQPWLPLVWATPLVAACAALALWVHTSVDSNACEVTEQSDHTRYEGRCDVELEAMVLQLSPGAVVEDHDSRVRLALGTARFSVHKVAAGQPPITIALPDASIEVLGTEFTVEVLQRSSRVHLHSGRVRFLRQGRGPNPDSGAVDMVPGQLLTFENHTGKTELVTLDASAASDPNRLHDAVDAKPVLAPMVADPSPVSAPSSAPGATSDLHQPSDRHQPSANDSKQAAKATVRSSAASPTPATTAQPSVLDEALRLRAAGRYDEALAALDDVSPQGTRAREVVDYERAALTEHTSPTRACARYRRHLVEFPQSRYRAAVLDKLARCNAPTNSPPKPASN